MMAALASAPQLGGQQALRSARTSGRSRARPSAAAASTLQRQRSAAPLLPATTLQPSSSGSTSSRELQQAAQPAGALQRVQSCLPAVAPGYGVAALAAALTAGGLLVGVHPAAAGELMSGAAFIPGLVGDDPVREGFIQALLLIFFSEIGDKTFFIALLLALQQPRSLVFAGTFGALAVMTVISVGLGRVLHLLDEVVPTAGLPLDDLLAIALLVWFGVQTLRSAATADTTAAEEKEEAQEVVDGFGSGAAVLTTLLSTFTLVFAAEWGDKSFLATIALAAASSPVGVVAGAVAGHGVATAIAVLGGSFLGKYLDEKVVQYVGGSLFLVFAAASVYDLAVGAH